ncbi:hypothetical protein GTO10_07075, partial [Candidatus Saccharibacteria bacterium]|nr:hypothetical protein [Candidatus Saccharibacteria bacterium]
GPLWFFLSVELIDGVEKAERRMAMEKRRIPRYLGQMIISLVLLLIVAIAAFAGKSELQREIAFINLLGGATIGALT